MLVCVCVCVLGGGGARSFEEEASSLMPSTCHEDETPAGSMSTYMSLWPSLAMYMYMYVHGTCMTCWLL